MANEKIVIDLELHGEQLLTTLKQIDQTATTLEGKAELLKKAFGDLTRATGMSVKEASKYLQELSTTFQYPPGTDPSLKFSGFATPLGADVTKEVFKEAEAAFNREKAMDKYITLDNQAAASSRNFAGGLREANKAIGEQSQKLQRLTQELNALKTPAQGRDSQGRFASVASFADQFKSMGTYSQQLRLVEKTISDLQKKTNLPFKDIGRELGKSFPELLKDTNLVNTAVQNLTKSNQGLSASFRAEAETIQLVKNKLTELQAAGRFKAAKGGNNAQVENLKGIIKEVSQATGAQYSQVANALEGMGVPAAQANAAVKGLNAELTKGTRSAQGFSHGIDVIRTALGTLTAVGIFNFMNLIVGAFQEATKAARELEDSLFRLSNVEKILSEGGADVSLEGLKKGILDIKKLFPIFSKEDVTQLVAQIAISTKELGFTEQQILDLAKAVGILNVRSTEEETASQTAQKVISSIITDNARGISALGLSFNETTMEIKAMEMGLLAAGQSVSDLTNEEKAQVKYQIILENTNGELANMGEYLDSNTAKMKQNTAAWHDMLTTWGQLFNTLRPGLTWLYGVLENAGNSAKALMAIFEIGRVMAASFVAAATSGRTLFESIQNILKAADALPQIFDKVGKSALKSLFPEGMPEDAPGWFKKIFGNLFEELKNETPTDLFAGMEERAKEEMQNVAEAVGDAEEKIVDIMAEARDKRAQIDENYRRKIEDAYRDHAQKLQDIARDVARKQEDALRDYNQKVEDINRDADEDILKAHQDYQQKEFEQEQEFQLKLKELRDEFLFDLEDALRERDARQVLRLIRRYNLDKKQLEERHKLEQQQSQIDLQQKLEQIERERQLKLEAARRELAEKQAEIQLWAEREREDAAIALQRKLADAREWHKRELIEYQQYLQQKLKSLADAIIKEYQLTAAGAQAIYNLLKSYFGGGGMIPNLLQNGLSANLNGILGGGNGGGWNNLSDTWKNLGFYGAAQGGNFIATRPTPLMVGEDGAEMVSVKPLTRAGSDTNKLFTSLGGGEGQAGGMMNLRIALSEGLVAEIVDASLDGVAATIEKIGREK